MSIVKSLVARAPVPGRAFSTTTPSTLILPSSRVLSWHTSGSPTGTPVLFIHGIPDSGVAMVNPFDHDIASRLGVRWLGIDRPGIGLSSPHPNRTLLQWTEDVRYFLDYHKLDRVRLFSVSGGTAHMLACLKHMPDRIQGAAIVAGIGPWEAGFEGQHTLGKLGMYAWRRMPWLLKMVHNMTLVRAAQQPSDAELRKLLSKAAKKMEPRDREMWEDPVQGEIVVNTFKTVYMQGGGGHFQDIDITLNDWGFKLDDVGYDGIRLWYGSEDINTPPEAGRYMAERLPGAKLRVIEGESHFTIWKHMEEILKTFLEETK